MEDTMELSINGEAFDSLRSDYDQAMQRLVKRMIEKGITAGEMSTKTKIFIGKDGEIIRPRFEHKIGSALQIKSEANSEFDGDVELYEDDETGKIVMRPREDPQMTIFDEEFESQADEGKIIALPNRAELPPAETELEEMAPEETDYIEAEYREIAEEPDESVLANSDDMEIKRISQAKADEITSSLEPLGLFYYIKGGRYIGMDNRAGIVFTEDFPTLDECKEWLTRVI